MYQKLCSKVKFWLPVPGSAHSLGLILQDVTPFDFRMQNAQAREKLAAVRCGEGDEKLTC